MYLPPASVLYISNIRIILDILLGLQPFSSPVINTCPNTLISSRHKCRKHDFKCTTIIKLYAACKLGVKNVLIFYFLKARKLVTIIYISSHNFQLRPPPPLLTFLILFMFDIIQLVEPGLLWFPPVSCYFNQQITEIGLMRQSAMFLNSVIVMDQTSVE